MSKQSDNLPPIIIAEYAIQLMQKAFRSKLGFRPGLSKNELEALFRKLQSSIMTLKYSYMPVNEIASHNEAQALKEGALLLEDTIKPALETKSTNQFPLSMIKWGVAILEGFPRRILSFTPDIGSGIDVIVVRVRNTQIRDKMVHTRAYDAKRDYTIMTNLLSVKSNINLAAAVLPPVEIDGYVSEAMYLGLEERSEEAGIILSPNKIDYKEVNGVLHHQLSRK